MYFNAYPITPDLGLRESINTMLAHVAYNGRDFGYLPSIVHESNYTSLLEDFGIILLEQDNTLVLAPKIKHSDTLNELVEILVDLCNNYSVYNEEAYYKLELDRLIDSIEDCRRQDDPPAEIIAEAFYDIGIYLESSEYGINFAEEDFDHAVSHARTLEADFQDNLDPAIV